MNRTQVIIGALLLVLVAGGGAEAVSSPSGIDPQLRLDWEAGQRKSGRPEITGYIYNDNGRAAVHVRLLVETLDGSGQVIDRTYGFVFGVVPVFNRTPFAVALRNEGASYRITVTSFEWRDSSGGG